MTYKDLILLKAIFNENLHNAIINNRYKMIHSIMRTEYIEDIKSHNITSLCVDLKEVKREHIKELESDNFKWAM